MQGVADDKVGLTPPSSYADQIALVLEQEILRGKYRRDEHLQQDEICRRFGVSRTPAREALRKLQALGLVQLVPNKGALVQVPTLQELKETYEVRAELEGFAAALATRHRTDELVARLLASQKQLADAVAASADGAQADGSTAPERLKQFNDDFHWLIHAAGGNRRLEIQIHDLERYFPKDTVRLAISRPDDLQRFYVAEHEQILSEILGGRAEAARDAMRHHIHMSQAMLLSYLKDLGFGD
jgi:DNA-binding GntR family transcriptional regulator